jgi:AcrR family transcriptional regulator
VWHNGHIKEILGEDRMTEELSNKEKIKLERVKRMKRFFIEITQKIILKDGIENLTIRKVAQEAGYNSATIYNYFKDLDHLILYASFKFLKPYTKELAVAVDDSMNAMEKYITIFYIFSKHTFGSPKIFWNMFYGKHYDIVDQLILEYYSLFPDEQGKHTEYIMKMLSSGNIFARERFLVEQIAKEGYITKDDTDHIVEIAIWTHESLLHEMCASKNSVRIEDQVKKYTECLKYVLRLAKTKDSKPVPLLESQIP